MNQSGHRPTDGTLIISADDVAAILRHHGPNEIMDRMIAAQTEAFGQLSEEDVILQPRDGFHTQHPEPALLEWMPILERQQLATIKLVAYIPNNPKARDLPTVIATISLYDYTSGHLIAVADGVLMTAIRTGAVSAVASRLLCRGEGGTVGMVGCGMQAVTQLHAVSRVLDVERVLIHDLSSQLEASFAARVAFLGLAVEPAPLEVVEREADILVTATSVEVGGGPVIRGDRLKPHVHINAIGSDFPGKTEIPLPVLERSLVCPDFREQAIREGECQQLTEDRIGPDLGELVRDAESFSSWRERTTVFDSTGSALEDHAAMKLLVELADDMGLGTRIRLEHLPADTYDPYALAEPAAVASAV